jgi:phage gpG-like protein
VANIVRKLANSVQKVTNSVRKVANTVEKVANIVRKLANSVQKVTNSVRKVANTIEKVACAVQKVANNVRTAVNTKHRLDYRGMTINIACNWSLRRMWKQCRSLVVCNFTDTSEEHATTTIGVHGRGTSCGNSRKFLPGYTASLSEDVFNP